MDNSDSESKSYLQSTKQATENGLIETIQKWLQERKTVVARLAVVVSLVIAIVVSGIFTYILFDTQQTDLGEAQYHSLADSALATIDDRIQGRVFALRSLTAAYSAQFPDVSTWPNVTLQGFDSVARNARLAASQTTVASFFVPIVTSEDRGGFEAFAADYVSNNYPPGVGVISTGVKIWKVDSTITAGDPRVPEDGEDYTWDAQYSDRFFPILQAETSDPSLLQYVMSNEGYRSPVAGAAIDSMLDCVYTAGASGMLSEEYTSNCEAGFQSLSPTDDEEFSLTIARPIYLSDPSNPEAGNTSVVGLISNMASFESMLEDTFPKFVSGIDVVIESSDGEVLTYKIDGGKVKLDATRDTHDSSFDAHKEKTKISDSSRLAASAVYYTVSIYPTEEFYEYYSTDSEWIAISLVVGMIILVSMIFAIYDFFMQRESSQKSAVLEARRAFVRYISHEIRTPLNTVYLGLRLLEENLTARIALMGSSSSVKNTRLEPNGGGEAGATSTAAAGGAGGVAGDSNVVILSAKSTPMKASSQKFINDTVYSVRGVTTVPASFYNFESSSAATIASTAASKVALEEWLDLCRDLLLNVRSAVDVLTDILNYDKVQTGTLALEVAVVPVWSTVRTTVNAFSLQAQQKNISLILNLECDVVDNATSPPPPPTTAATTAAAVSATRTTIMEAAAEKNTNPKAKANIDELTLLGDEGYLVQVIRNLVSNALKFTTEGGTVTVTGTLLLGKVNDVIEQSESGTDKRIVARQAQKLEAFHRRSSAFRSSSTAATPIESDVDCSRCFAVSGNSNKSAAATATTTAAGAHNNKFRAVGTLCLAVTDSGAGLSEEQLSQLFQEGVQFSRNRLQAGGGSGLGLSIAKGIVTQHGGVLQASSKGLSKGSTFTLFLPAYLARNKSPRAAAMNRSAAAASKSTSTSPGGDVIITRKSQYSSIGQNLNRLEEGQEVEEKTDDDGVVGEDISIGVPTTAAPVASTAAATTTTAGSEGNAGGSNNLTALTNGHITAATHQPSCSKDITQLNVLVVDDSDMNRKMLVRMLKSKGHKYIAQAEDGLDALSKYQNALDAKDPFDLILMDYEMPKMNGPSAAQQLRVLGYKEVIVGVTGNVMAADKALFINHGADAVLGKPFEYCILIEIINDLRTKNTSIID